MVFDLLLV